MVYEKARRRPNVILFITDQQRADCLSCYGHPVLKTPHIDAIAANGVRFESFYVASPVCMPNRASLMTGRLPSVHGVRLNGVPLSARNATFVESLRAAGYRTALIGKSHLQNFTDTPPERLSSGNDSGSRCEAIRHDLDSPLYEQETPRHWLSARPRLRLPFYGFEHVDLVIGHGDRCGGDYGVWLRQTAPDAAARTGAANQLTHDYVCPQAVRTALPEELYSTQYIADRSVGYLEATSSEPFFLMVSFPDPHHPFTPPGRYWNAYRPTDMPVPEAFTRDDWRPPPPVAAILEAGEGGAARRGGALTIGCSRREALEARALTCGMIAFIDDAIGQVMDALRRTGRQNDTVVAFTSDHGDHLGDHRLLLKGAEHYQALIRVPFIWSDPEGPSGAESMTIGQTIDIAPTILKRAGVSAYAGIQGIDLFSGQSRDAALIQYEHQKNYPGLDGPPRVHTLVDGRWRLSLPDGCSWGELYDLEADPGEFRNLWDDASATGEKSRLLEQLARAEIAAVDQVPLPTRLA